MEKIKSWLVSTCVLFTSFSLFFLIVGLISPETQGMVLSPGWFLRLLLYAAVASAGRLCRKTESWNKYLRVAIHALCVCLGFYLILFLPFAHDRSYPASTYLIVFVLAAALYALIYFLCHLIGSRIGAGKKTETEPEKGYQKQFRK
jgi:hypothetical protein